MPSKEFYKFGEIIHALRAYYIEEQEILKSMKEKIKIEGDSDIITKLYVESYEKTTKFNTPIDGKYTKVILAVNKDPNKSLKTRIIDSREYESIKTHAEYNLVINEGEYKFVRPIYPSKKALNPTVTITDPEGFKGDMERLEKSKWYVLKTSGGEICLNQMFFVDAQGVSFKTYREGRGQVIYRYDAESDTVILHFDKKYDGLSSFLLLNQRIPGFIFDQEMRDTIEANTESEEYGNVDIQNPSYRRDNQYTIYDYPRRMILAKKEDK